MKTVKKKMAIVIFLALLVIISVFFGTLIGLDRASAQGSGQQQGQALGLGGLNILGGLGAGAMMGLQGLNMVGPALGMTGLGSLGIVNPLGIGLPMAGSGSVNMAGAAPGITVGGLFGGLGNMYGGSGLYGGLFGGGGGMYGGYGLYGGISPLGGPFMPIMGLGIMYPGMPPVIPFSNFLGDGLPIGYGGYYTTSLGNVVRMGRSNSTGITGVPYFVTADGRIVTSPLPYLPWMTALYQPSFVPVVVAGFVYDDETGLPLEDVEVTIVNSSPKASVLTDPNGLYVFRLPSEDYTFGYTKYRYEYKSERVIVYSGMKTVDVYLQPDNYRPKFNPLLPIEVPAGETITLDPDVFAYDPDGDQLDFFYSGWKEDYWESNTPYTTNGDDIGEHEVTITIKDKEYTVIEDLKIIVSPGYKLSLYKGYNLISYPFENGDPDFTASDLLEVLGDTNKIDSIAYYDNNTDKYIWYDPGGDRQVTDFSIKIGQGYIIYANKDIEKIVFNRYTEIEQPLNLYEGMNLIGLALGGYTSYGLLVKLGYDCVESIYRYNPLWGDWEATYWLNGSPAGDIFPIFIGEGYHIQMKTQCSSTLPRLRFFIF